MCIRFAAILLVSLAIALPAHARTFTSNYAIYGGGMRGLEASVSITFLENDHYRIHTKAETRGAIGFFYPMKATYKTRGTLEETHPVPAFFESTTQSRRKKRKKKLHYNKDGIVTERIRIKNGNKSRTPVKDPALSRGAMDYQSLLVAAMMKLKEEKECNENLALFDGEERFDVRFKDEGIDSLSESSYSSFSGPARLCRLSVKPRAGNPDDWFWNLGGDGDPPPIRIWLADSENTGIPVMVRTELETPGFGVVVAHLKSLEITGEKSPPPAEKSPSPKGK